MAICEICKQFGGPHRMSGKPCANHRNEVCLNCWKQHLASIIQKGTTLTCAQCTKPLSKTHVKDCAAHVYEYIVEVMNVVAAQKAVAEPAKLPADKADKVEDSAKKGDGAAADAGVDDSDDEDFELVEKEDAVGDDWEVIDDDEM